MQECGGFVPTSSRLLEIDEELNRVGYPYSPDLLLTMKYAIVVSIEDLDICAPADFPKARMASNPFDLFRLHVSRRLVIRNMRSIALSTRTPSQSIAGA